MNRRDFMSLVAAGAASSAIGNVAVPAAHAKGGDATIGFSIGYFAHDWRRQMISGAQEQFGTYKAEGLAKDLVVQQAGGDVGQQIQDLRNMIRAKVAVITVNANSATALNGAINEAKRAEIPVVSFDQRVTNPYAINVTVDHYAFGQAYAQWIAKTLGGKGKVVVVNGIAGHPAAEARRQAALDTFKQYPGIEVVWSGYGDWDHAKAQSVMATVIAAQPQIDGAFVEDSMGLGVLRAFQNARRPIPVMTAEAQKAFLLAWKQELDGGTDMKAFARPNPPDISRNAIGIAVRLANGRKLKAVPENTIFYPIKLEVTRDNLVTILDSMKDRPDSYYLSEWFSEPQLDAFFE
ncbi:substrate-binding domain-containing protein [Ancylobacter sonchi]|uniref:substrate-binding domain-containing protein n=1 Tax=Ancylobacter sonchi TaxID=1937790 RepID=UPI001BD58C4D|nr:substrate-binding domain-containing protein [Ancylobacter sonchi]MBS7533421.1 substrate-binding domain-containing protein [Ancylobacter sonchi]